MSSRCRRHTTNLSGTVGVCASCLRERLLAVIAEQDKAQNQPPSEHLDFSRSVSPFVARRKSDTSATRHLPNGHIRHDSVHGRWLFSTPQVGPSGSVTLEAREKRRSRRKKLSSLLFSGFFRSNPHSPSSWLSSVFTTRRMKQKSEVAAFSAEECDEVDNSSGESSESSSWRQRRSNTPANNSSARRRTASESAGRSGLAFCLSPLVRASPNRRNRSHELTVVGESRAPHLPNAASFCSSRSRKLADFGRYNSYSGKCNR